MNAFHECREEAGRTLDVLTSTAGDSRLTVARLGAEPVSLAARASTEQTWRGFLYRDGELGPAPEGWNNHATVMGYYLHRIKDGRSFYRGREIRGGTHSFLRHTLFRAPEVNLESASLSYAVEPADYDAADYPFRVALRLTYQLEAGGLLRVRFRFENREPDTSTHVSFGLHPGFAVASLDTCQVLLPPGQYRRYLAPGNFLSGETATFHHAGGPMPFAKQELPGSFLLDLADVPDRTFTLFDPDGGRQVTLSCAEAPYLTLWSDGHAFVCLEPCWGMPDHHEQRPFEEKLGIEEIAPGGTLEREFSIRVQLC